MKDGLPATVRADRLRRGRRRPGRPPPGPRPGRDPYGGDCVGGCCGRWYVVGHRDAGTGPLPATPVVLASCGTRAEALALAALFRARLPQYARVGAERAGGR